MINLQVSLVNAGILTECPDVLLEELEIGWNLCRFYWIVEASLQSQVSIKSVERTLS